MRSAVIVDAVRTPIARSGEKSLFKDVRADDLGAALIKALLRRTELDPNLIEDVIFGCANQQGEQGINVGRVIALLAGLPVEVAGTTVDRQCGSSLQAVNFAAMSIMTGSADVVVAGGVEHMTHVPMGTGANPHPRLFERFSPSILMMGITAEVLAERTGIGRSESDRFALWSHAKAVAAQEAGRFNQEIIPVSLPDQTVIEKDQHPRKDTSLEKLSLLAPVFKLDGQVTAGNSSGVNDGAAALLMMSEEMAQRLHLRPMAVIRAMAVYGVDPEIMGIGPVPATQRALKRSGLKLEDIGIIEINEAFACQVLSCLKELGISADDPRINPNGGAIALGHPLGCSGARIMTTLVHEMKRTGARYGLATMCIGFGQGIATIVERP